MPGQLLLQGKRIVPFPEAPLDGFSKFVGWWLVFFAFFSLSEATEACPTCCVCCWGASMCQAAINLIFGLKFFKGETQELSVAANVFSCYAPYCHRGIVIREEGD